MMRFQRTLLFVLPLFSLLLAAGCGDARYPTPLEQAGADSLTSHDAMMAFLGDLQEGTQAFSMETVGASVEGRPIVLLHFQDPCLLYTSPSPRD